MSPLNWLHCNMFIYIHRKECNTQCPVHKCRTATHCNTLQHTATHCNIHCNAIVCSPVHKCSDCKSLYYPARDSRRTLGSINIECKSLYVSHTIDSDCKSLHYPARATARVFDILQETARVFTCHAIDSNKDSCSLYIS